MEHVYLRAFFKHETVEHVDVLSARDKIQKRRVFVPRLMSPLYTMPSALPSFLPVAGRLVEKRPTMKRFAEPPILWTIKQVGEQEETDPRLLILNAGRFWSGVQSIDRSAG